MTGTRTRIAVSADELIYGIEASTPASPPPAASTDSSPGPAIAHGRLPGVEPGAPTTPSAAPAPEVTARLVSRVVFTNQLKPDVYRELRQYEYWAHMELHEILHEAVVAYLADKPEAKKELPPKVAAKLLQRLVRKSN